MAATDRTCTLPGSPGTWSTEHGSANSWKSGPQIWGPTTPDSGPSSPGEPRNCFNPPIIENIGKKMNDTLPDIFGRLRRLENQANPTLLYLGKDKSPLLEGVGTRIPALPTGPAPTVRWKGGAITPVLWNVIKSWSLKTFQECQGETLLDLFYHPAKGRWAVNPPLQATTTGLSVHRIPANAEEQATQALASKNLQEYYDRTPDHRRLYRQGYVLFGSIHHHCYAGAHQSGADAEDEIGRPGLHITLGGLSSPTWSIHARLVFEGVQYPIDLGSFFGGEPPSLQAPVLTPAMERLCNGLTQNRLIPVSSVSNHITVIHSQQTYWGGDWGDEEPRQPRKRKRRTAATPYTPPVHVPPAKPWSLALQQDQWFNWDTFKKGYWAHKQSLPFHACFVLLADLADRELDKKGFWQAASTDIENDTLVNPEALSLVLETKDMMLDAKEHELFQELLEDILAVVD